MSVTTIPVAHSAPSPSVTVTHLGFAMLARREKVQALAAAFFKGGVTPEQVWKIEPQQWVDLTADLKRARVLRPHATVPSLETIVLTVAELKRLRERRCSHRRAA